jgi:hypothetical protein
MRFPHRLLPVMSASLVLAARGGFNPASFIG